MLENLPPLRDVIEAHDLRAEKKLGQNFLLDQNVTDKIVRACGDISAHTVFEIGPGPGGLTRSLLRAGASRVIAIEFDPRAVAALQDLVSVSDGRLKVVHGDAMGTDLLALAPEGPRAIVANLPYNIATPLFLGWLKDLYSDYKAYDFMVLMFQKEVAERMSAEPGNSAYGRLAVITQWLCECSKVMDLSPAAFTPPPKVTSRVVKCVPKIQDDSLPNFENMESLTQAAFGQRRKMLRSSMKGYLSVLDALAIDPTLRAENLDVETFVRMARYLS